MIPYSHLSQSSILSDTGGTCVCLGSSASGTSCTNQAEFDACKNGKTC